MALGLTQAGFDIKYAFDFDAQAVATYNTNFNDQVCAHKDAREVSVEELLDIAEVEPGELDLISGGPPCQGFSKQKRGAHLFDDERNLLMKDFIRIVEGIRPKTFMLENVAIFGQKRGEPYLKELENTLDSYDLYPHFYNAADYGIAQTRQRFVLVGVRQDLNLSFSVPAPTYENNWVTIRQAFKGLPQPPEDGSPHPKIPNHYKSKITQENEHRFSFVPQGGGWQDIPWEFRLKCHQVDDAKQGGWPDVYGRLSWNGQCPTITGGFDSFSRGRYGHPKYNRAITPREAARLQGFPDDFAFQGNRGEVRLQIGNAVPPPLSKEIASNIIKMLENKLDVKPSIQKQRQLFA